MTDLRIHLIRHGQTDWNAVRRVQGHSESELNALGRQQAQALAGNLDSLPLAAVYCSSSVRTRQTADHAFGHRGLPMHYRDDLREIFLGPWEGRLYAELERDDPEQFYNFWQAPHRFHVAGAETFDALQQRGVAALKSICKDTTRGDIAVVSHGALIKAILTHFEGKSLDRLWDPPQMHNCSHSILELDEQGSGHIVRYL
ncbi:MAG: hypothetical protein RLZZ385_550 [Pseudomonadota bacterium]|jgi:probable phosphoglycerate mutase